MSRICTFALLRAWHVSLLVVAVAFAFSGCVGVDALRDPVPEMLITEATVPGYSGIRFWGDDPSAVTPEMVQEFFAQKAAAIAAEPSLKRNTAYGLTISGGGSNGAFGAGLLAGWSAHGDRPKFFRTSVSQVPKHFHEATVTKSRHYLLDTENSKSGMRWRGA